MSNVIAVANQKGGVGKTTTAVNLSACLAGLGKKVLLLDIDPQGNATSGIGIERGQIRRCIYDAIINELPLTDIIMQSRVANLAVAPASIQLAGAEIELVPTMSRELRLKKVLDDLPVSYDFVIVDCPPSLDMHVTVKLLERVDSVLIPVLPSPLDLWASAGTVEAVRKARDVNPGLRAWLILNQTEPRSALSRAMAGAVASLELPVIETPVRRRAAFRLSVVEGMSVYQLGARGAAAMQEIEQVIEEIMQQ